jgi:hypothetical protein
LHHLGRQRHAAGSDINDVSVVERHAARRVQAPQLVLFLDVWMRGERDKLSRRAEVAKAMGRRLKCWAAFIRFLDDGWVCLTNSAAKRDMCVVPGRKAWLFAGPDRSDERAAAMYSLTAKLNGVDPFRTLWGRGFGPLPLLLRAYSPPAPIAIAKNTAIAINDRNSHRLVVWLEPEVVASSPGIVTTVTPPSR